MQTETKRKPAPSAAAAPRGDDAPPAPDAPLRVPKVEGAPAPGVVHCLVTPKLLFSVPRDASWRVAGDVPQHILREGFSRRFPLTIAGLDHLSFEAVGKRELGAAGKDGGDPPAVYRLTSSDEAEERILLGILRALERAYESKHRLALDQARTDMLSSSMTFQVMADEIRARQEESKAKFDKETAKLKDNLTTTSKRLFLLEHEKDSLTKAFHSSTETTQLLQNTVEKLHRENLEMRDRMAKLESRLAEVCDGRGFADVAPAARLPVASATSHTQTELVILAPSAAAGVSETKSS